MWPKELLGNLKKGHVASQPTFKTQHKNYEEGGKEGKEGRGGTKEDFFPADQTIQRFRGSANRRGRVPGFRAKIRDSRSAFVPGKSETPGLNSMNDAHDIQQNMFVV